MSVHGLHEGCTTSQNGRHCHVLSTFFLWPRSRSRLSTTIPTTDGVLLPQTSPSSSNSRTSRMRPTQNRTNWAALPTGMTPPTPARLRLDSLKHKGAVVVLEAGDET